MMEVDVGIMTPQQKKRRTFGIHLTPVQVFKKYILPEIKDRLNKYIWVDLFAGSGNLILPMLDLIPESERVDFFREHIYMFDVRRELVQKSIENALSYGIPRDIAEERILQRDTIKNYPEFLLDLDLPVYHITNPPYLYIGYIVKNSETRRYLEYFRGDNEGYQDLYQLGLINDLRHGVKNMVYIIPSNFLFGSAVSNRIRNDVLMHYTIKKAIIFEMGIFEHTGTNVMICFFERKESPVHEVVSFVGFKINRGVRRRVYSLSPKNNYRSGGAFDEFVRRNRAKTPLRVNYYLTIEDVERNGGDHEISVIDANSFNGREYERRGVYVNKELHDRIKSNILFVRTVDTGRSNGRAGLYLIKDVFGVDGILVSKRKYRTHPIQIFLDPPLSHREQILLKNYFNRMLEILREKTDSEFMTTYKYSRSEYTRKYLGLSQVRKLIQTFPILDRNEGVEYHLMRKYRRFTKERVGRGSVDDRAEVFVSY